MLSAMTGKTWWARNGPEGENAPEPDDHARDPGQDLDGEAEWPRDPRGHPLGQGEGGADGQRHGDDDGDQRGGDGAPDDRPRPVLGTHGVGHAIGVHDGAVPAPLGPGPPVEEVPAVDPDGRPRLYGEDG